MISRLPNLAVGVLTRDSVRQALRSGITAKQIVDFLRQHAHPEMMKELPALPLTIVDQVLIIILSSLKKITYTFLFCRFSFGKMSESVLLTVKGCCTISSCLNLITPCSGTMPNSWRC